MTDHDYGGWIEMYSGRRIDLRNPDPDQFLLDDIAHALSLQCRYTGHVDRFYSVAEHCVLLAQHVLDKTTYGPRIAMLALMHDGAEAFIGDMASPLKAILPDYKKIEKVFDHLVREKFVGAVNPLEWARVKDLDNRILKTEREQLMPNTGDHEWSLPPGTPLAVECEGWEPGWAELQFLRMHRKLDKAIQAE